MKNYKEITNDLLNRRNEYLEMKKKYKYLALGICIIFLSIITISITNNLKDNNETTPIYKDNIVINKTDNLESQNTSIAGGIYDIAGGFYEKAVKELEGEYPFINDLFIFGDKTKNQRIGQYRFDEGKPQGFWQGYFVIYTDDTENKGVQIFFSKTMTMQPRDVGGPIVLEELEDSHIMNTPVKIIQTGNYYIAFFSKNNLHFDIEITNGSQEELINLIQAIVGTH